MKILENPNPVPSIIHTCEKCGCKFEYTERDIIKYSNSDANGRIGGTYYYCYQESVDCPNCGEPYIIKKESGYTNSCIEYPVSKEITACLSKLCTQ
jgi:hypothetical protein